VFSVRDALADSLVRAGGAVVLLILGQDGEQMCGAEGCDAMMGHSGTQLDFLGLVPRTLGALTWATRFARTRGGRSAVFTWR
jgi:hypothetical protein